MRWSPYALGTQAESCFGHGCSGHRMLLEHKRNYGLGMDALVTVCSWNTSKITVSTWMLWSPYNLGIDRQYGLGMDALVIACTTLWFERSPHLKVHKPSICSLASKRAAWNTPQMTSEPSNLSKSLFFAVGLEYQPNLPAWALMQALVAHMASKSPETPNLIYQPVSP